MAVVLRDVLARSEQETGKYVLPAREWPSFRSRLIAGWNAYQEDRYAAAKTIYDRLASRVNEGDDCDLPAVYDAIVRRSRLNDADPLDQYGDLFGRLFSGDKRVPRAPHKHEFPSIGPRMVDASLAMPDAQIVLNGLAFEVHWNATFTGRSIERARAHPVARVFFDSLGAVKWAAKTGGYVLFSEESISGDRELERSATVRDPHGPLGAIEIAARTRGIAGTGSVRAIKPGMR